MSWLDKILWSFWFGFSTAGSVLFLLAAGLALFGLFVGLPYVLRQRRRRRLAEIAVGSVEPSVREQVLSMSRALGGFPPSELILLAAPQLREPLSGLGIPPEEIIDRLLAAEAPMAEEPAELQ